MAPRSLARPTASVRVPARCLSSVRRAAVVAKPSSLHALRMRSATSTHSVGGEEAKRIAADPRVLEAHRQSVGTLQTVLAELERRGVVTRLLHDTPIQAADVAWADVVVTVGGDGTFLLATHAVPDGDRTPVLGVNSAPSSSLGYFCACDADGFGRALAALAGGEREPVPLWRMRVSVNGEELPQLATNDALFAARSASATARYMLYPGTDRDRACKRGGVGDDALDDNPDEEGDEHKSSGVWVATAAGSSAAIRSAGGIPVDPREKVLQYRVRELFALNGRVWHEPVGGFLPPGFRVRSRMSGGGLYLDGREDMVPVRFGDVITFDHAAHPLMWVPHDRPRQSLIDELIPGTPAAERAGAAAAAASMVGEVRR